MGYFDNDGGVDEYIQMAEGYDGRELIEVLRRHVPSGSSVLELGMGPGKDLALRRSKAYRLAEGDFQPRAILVNYLPPEHNPPCAARRHRETETLMDETSEALSLRAEPKT